MNVVPAKQKLRRTCAALTLQACRRNGAGYHATRSLAQSQQQLPANTSEAEIQSARAYCANLLRTHDAPSHTLQTFIPPHARDAYLALRALNITLSQIPSLASTPAVGHLRFQFWRDALAAALAHTPRKEPISTLLSHASLTLTTRTDNTHRFSLPWLHRVVAARAAQLGDPPVPDLAAAERAAEHAYATLLYLTLQALPLGSLAADHVASHVGKAQGLVATLRGLPLLAFPGPANHHGPQPGAPPQGSVPLPLAVMAAAGVRETDVLRLGGAAPGLRDAVFAVAARAHDHLATAREMVASLAAGRGAGHAFEEAGEGHGGGGEDDEAAAVRAALGALMPAVAAQLWLERLQRADFDVFAPGLRRGLDWRLPWRAYWAYRGGRL